ncbi:MAG: LuxR family transcriptional regulator [Pseudorhodobacter sp.]|nr:MAG: LuxR family transcriptional regulator [Pseudorhodobacter sp.]
MTRTVGLDLGLSKLSALAPAGYALGLHIRFASAQIMVNTYDPRWIEIYTNQGYMLCDPLVSWGFGTEGTVRWSALNHPDPHNVLRQAAAFGLKFGVAVSHGPTSSRTIGGFGRSDREFSDEEIADIADMVRVLHRETEPPERLSPAQVEALRLISKGYRYSQAAHHLGISESALKARLSSARDRLLCRTTAEAIQRALEAKLL